MNSATPHPANQIVTDALASEFAQQTKVHLNLGQETIIITEDKVRLCLMTHLKHMEARNAWVAPAGILVTIVASFLSSTFRDFMLDAPTWRALFIVAAVLSLGWLLVSLGRAWKTASIEDVVEKMKHAGAQAGGV